MTDLKLTRALSAVLAATTTATAFLPTGIPPITLTSSQPCSSILPARVSRAGSTRPSPWQRPIRQLSTGPPSQRVSGISMSDSAGMDTLIDDLKAAPDPETLTLKVSKSVQQVAQPAFFLRIAERAESTQDADQKAAFEKLAVEVTGALEKLVNFAEEKMDDASSLLQIIVTSAAEKNGEFIVPLSQERLQSLRQSIKIHRDQLDNNFLATVQAWMEKCSKEQEMEGMVVILQKILQIYASQEILEGQRQGLRGKDSVKTAGEVEGQPKRTRAGQLLDRILETDADQWNGVLSSLAVQGQGMTGGVTKDSLLGAVQVAVETVILQQENGSMAQRVQAEFLTELCKRIEAAAPERPPGILERSASAFPMLMSNVWRFDSSEMKLNLPASKRGRGGRRGRTSTRNPPLQTSLHVSEINGA